MTAGLPRTLALLYVVFVASAVRAEDQSAASPVAAASYRAAKQRSWFSFVKKMRVQRTTRDSPPIVSGVVLSSLLGGGVAVWLLLRIVRFRMRARRASNGKIQEQEMAALLGVLFGFPAGMCIYDNIHPYLEKNLVSDAS